MSKPLTFDARSQRIADRHATLKNTRMDEQMRESFLSDGGASILGVMLIPAVFMAPFLFIPLLIASFVFLRIGRDRKLKKSFDYPLYTPGHSKSKLDQLDINPANRKPRKPQAILYMGIEPSTKRQVWLTDEVVRQHMWLQATTGGGKTETLMGLATNFYMYGSAFLMIDGKADQKLPAKVCAMSHRFMRSNSVYLINYITGNSTPWGKLESERSSTINPFLTGSVGSLSELVKSLLNDDGDIWSKRCQSFVDALTRVLVYMRDQGELKFNITHYGQYLQLEELGKLAGRSDIPMHVKRELYQFVKTLPGLDAEGFKRLLDGQGIDPKKSQQPLDQLGYITMQIIPIINTLQGDYGYIFDVIYGSVNVRDIVIKRRTLIVLLPALEKAASSLRALGQLVVALIRDLLASGIGSQMEGNIDKALKRRFTNDIAPYLAIFDEAGYYFVENAFAPIFAQARSIGMACVMGSQDDYAMEKAGDAAAKEVGTVRANSNTKLIGKIEDTGVSMDKVLERVSEVTVYEEKELEREFGSTRYKGQRVTAERRKALDKEDFLDLREGEVFLLHQSRHVRVDMFAIFPPELKNQQCNALVPSGSLTKYRQELIGPSYRRVRSSMIHIDRKKKSAEDKPLKDPYKSAFDGIDLSKGMVGACLAMKSVSSGITKRLEEQMAILQQVRSTGKVRVEEHTKSVQSTQEGSETIDDPYSQGQSDPVGGSDSPQPQVANITTRQRPRYVNEFDAMLNLDTTMKADLMEINALSGNRNADPDEIYRAENDADATVDKLNTALRQYPGPPPIKMDRAAAKASLEQVREILKEDIARSGAQPNREEIEQ